MLGGTFAGYQGWFGCPSDGPGRGWEHWFHPDGSLSVDILPDMAGIPASDSCVTSLKHRDGSPVLVFSSQNPHIVLGHFRFLQRRAIQGVALQRFVAALQTPDGTAERDRVLANVVQAAGRTGRTFYIEYDITGADAHTWPRTLLEDWRRLCAAGLVSGPSYQHHTGRPVLGIYGFGYADRPATPASALALIDALAFPGPGADPALCGGVPWNWRTPGSQQAAWAPLYAKLTVISPWTIGAYATPAEAEAFCSRVTAPDIAYAAARRQVLMPVVYPGFSAGNRNRNPAKFDKIPQAGGRFLDAQLRSVRTAGAALTFQAMVDEFDEGTALLPRSSVEDS